MKGCYAGAVVCGGPTLESSEETPAQVGLLGFLQGIDCRAAFGRPARLGIPFPNVHFKQQQLLHTVSGSVSEPLVLRGTGVLPEATEPQEGWSPDCTQKTLLTATKSKV